MRRPLQAMMMVVVMVTMMTVKVRGGLLEETGHGRKTETQKVQISLSPNQVTNKGFTEAAALEPLPCIDVEASGVVTCDNNPKCCQTGSPRITGTDYCCPPGSSQYHFQNNGDFICACAL